MHPLGNPPTGRGAPYPNLVGGEWLPSGEARLDVNPSDLDEVIGEFCDATPGQVVEAVAAAREAATAWTTTAPRDRAEILERVGLELRSRSAELGELLSREEGKRLTEGVAEVRRAAEIFLYYSSEAYRSAGELLPGLRGDVEIEVRREPVGVVGIITPWNFPMAIPAWKIAPALAYGNTVVFKPAELVPASAWELTDIIRRAGIPAGAFNLVMGDGRIGEALVSDAGVDGVSFTGSTVVGRRVAAATVGRLAKVQLELGGKNPLVVLDDADLDAAVDCAVQGAFYSTGQRCTASSRLIVTRGIYRAFVDALAERVQGLRVGHALHPETDVGPVVDEAQLRKDLEYIGIGISEGATALLRGDRVERERRGHYLSPTLFVDSDNSMRINREEIFGPVASVIEARDYEEALEIARDTEYGLVAGICTNSLKHANHFKRAARAGMVMVNLPTAGMDYHAPFGGTKASSYGAKEQGTHAREFFTQARVAYVRG